MPTQIELFSQMVPILDRLVDNAKKMKEGLRLKFSQTELEELQMRQHEILHELAELNKLVEKSHPGASEDELDMCKGRIREKLSHFQAVNQEFFDHINTHTRVIDTKDTKKKA